MKYLLDTSVLCAAIITSHPQNIRCLEILQKAHGSSDDDYIISAHSLLEVYSTLTAIPASPKLRPLEVKHIITNSIERVVKVKALDATSYSALIDKVSNLGLTGGVVYDALIVEVGLQNKVDRILTLNEKDFLRVAGEHTDMISLP